MLSKLRGKTVILGVIALDTDEVESAETVAERIRRALPSTRDLIAAPDCGMKYLTREAAFGKLRSLVDGARAVSEELAGGDRRARGERGELGPHDVGIDRGLAHPFEDEVDDVGERTSQWCGPS